MTRQPRRMRSWVIVAALGMACSPGTPDAPRAPVRGSDVPTPEPDAIVQPDTDASPTPQVLAPSPAPTPTPSPSPEPDPLRFPSSRSTSIGSCTTGRLEGGIALPLEAPGLLFHPAKDPGSRFGTVELVQGLVRATTAVERSSPGAALTVGDIARESGGDIPGHATHRSGRDVDVLFYLLREDGTPFLPAKAIPLDPEGRGTDYGDLADPTDDVPVHIDEARMWSFVAALLSDEAAAVQKILIVEHLRRRLLDEAERVHAPPAVVQRFAEVTCQPRFPHDDHMHIRVFCSAEDVAGGCVDAPPIYPWHQRELSAAGVKAVTAGRDDDAAAPTPKPKPKKRPKLKTIAQARAEAGPMHEDVVEFLDRRDTWAKQPHPGRRWCR